MRTETTTALPSGEPAGSPGPPPRRDRLKGRLLAAAVACVTLCLHVWIISAGRWTNWPSYGAYYSKLADGFARGQASLVERPDPRLLALPDPYDPRANRDVRLHDAVLYGGRYYFYWGPLPALLLVPHRLLAAGAGPVGDEYLVFAFDLLLVAAWTSFLVRARERLFPGAPWWAAGLSVLAAGTGGMLAYTLARPWVYEAAVLGGQAFLTAGLYCVLVAVTGRTLRPRAGWLAAAGACCGCALACRFNLLPAVGTLAACVGWLLWRAARAVPTHGHRAGAARAFAAIVLPVGAAVAALAAYNAARFGSPTEFGVRYQLAGIHSSKVLGEMFAARYVPANVYRALFNELTLLPEFPYVRPSARRWELHEHFISDPVAGVAWSAPFLAFALVPPLAAARRLLNRRRAADREAGPADPGTGDAAAVERWLGGVTLPAVTVLAFLPAAAILASTPRYVLELTTPASLLAGVGLYQALRDARDQPGARRCVAALAVAAVGLTVVIAPLLGTQGEGDHLQRHNPALYRALGGVPNR